VNSSDEKRTRIAPDSATTGDTSTDPEKGLPSAAVHVHPSGGVEVGGGKAVVAGASTEVVCSPTEVVCSSFTVVVVGGASSVLVGATDVCCS